MFVMLCLIHILRVALRLQTLEDQDWLAFGNDVAVDLAVMRVSNKFVSIHEDGSMIRTVVGQGF